MIIWTAAYWTDTVRHCQVQWALILTAVLWALGCGRWAWSVIKELYFVQRNKYNSYDFGKNLFTTRSNSLIVHRQWLQGLTYCAPSVTARTHLLCTVSDCKKCNIWGLDHCDFGVYIISFPHSCYCLLDQYVSPQWAFDNTAFIFRMSNSILHLPNFSIDIIFIWWTHIIFCYCLQY
jgi:hypothetical protein